jgi:hypothetical protein
MYNRKIVIRSVISILLFAFYLVYIDRYSLNNIIVPLIALLFYNFKLFKLNRCPQCNNYMNKDFSKSLFLPDVEICKKDGYQNKITYNGENNM